MISNLIMLRRDYSKLPDPEQEMKRECVSLSASGSYLRVKPGELPPNYIPPKKINPSYLVQLYYSFVKRVADFSERIFRRVLS